MTERPAVVQIPLRWGGSARALDWGGAGEDVVVLHPNGFCAGVFDPLARRLAGAFRFVGIDLRGHGGSDAPGHADDYHYAHLAADVLDVMDHLSLAAPTIIGESLGGGVAVLVDRAQPGRLRRLVLCEAVAFPTRSIDPQPNPLSEGARRRRREWPGLEEMRRSYAAKEPLAELAPDALDAYLRWGTRMTERGTVELLCRPEVEATIFELAPTPMGGGAAWQHLDELSCPARVVAGAASFLPPDLFEQQAWRIGVAVQFVPGGHFFLQQDPDVAARLVERSLRT